VLHTFLQVNDGAAPTGLIFDQAGNLYGTTEYGGLPDRGTVFKLTPDSGGGWIESLLYIFCDSGICSDGDGPAAGVIFDQAGNLYGTTVNGGDDGCWDSCGVVFELTPNQQGGWTESVIHSFVGGEDGGNPYAALTFDAAGNLYGTTMSGGPSNICNAGCGTVFELTPNPEGSWTEHVLRRFSGAKDGGEPYAGGTLNAAGSLFGTTYIGGNRSLCDVWSGGCGVVFALASNSKGGWHESVLQTFSDKPAALPMAALIFDTTGNLYGTTSGDGTTTFGTVFEITP
jgi:uncharacterized repeat protein (TIGR03803 family)